MDLDPAAARRLRKSARWVGFLGAIGTLIVGGFIAVALIDPDGLSPATRTDAAPGWLAWSTSVLTVGVLLLVAALIGLVRLGRQRRTLAGSAFARLPARWAPTRVRGQSVPEVAIEEPDGSWLALRFPATVRTGPFENAVRAAGAVDVARAGGYAVVRAPGSSELLSAKPRGMVTEPPLDPLAPVVTLRAGAVIASDDAGDAQVWFRDAFKMPPGATIRSMLLIAYITWVIVTMARDGRDDSVGGVLFAVFLFTAGVAAPVTWFVMKTVTSVDRAGITRRRTFQPPRLVTFDRISTVARYPVVKPSHPTKLVVTLDDGATVRVLTRRPDEFLAALRRGRDFA